jgi:toxin YoeB
MRLQFTERGWQDYQYWQANDARMLRKINDLLKDCGRTPFDGLGKPEALRRNLSGWWSRRINEEHRLIYRVLGDVLEIAACRFHYSD